MKQVEWRKWMGASWLVVSLTACKPPCYNPNGCNNEEDARYQTVAPMTVKGIQLPIGTIIGYDKKVPSNHALLKRPLAEKKVRWLQFPENSDIRWGGVRVVSLSRFFNTDMRGISVEADGDSLQKQNTSFAKLWDSCNDRLGVLLHDINNWSFNQDNIADVSSCSVIYQRFFKDDVRIQRFLDNLLRAMRAMPSQQQNK